jgi:5-methylcytosine-specific restriction endonuclease McrA
MTTYSKVNIGKMSLTTLRSKRTIAEKRIEELRAGLVSEAQIKAELEKIKNYKSEISKLNDVIFFQRQRREISTGWMGAIFKKEVIPKSALDSIEISSRKIQGLEVDVKKSEAIISGQAYTKKRIENGLAWLERLNSRIQILENKETKQQSLRNKAAESTKQKRLIAKGVKKSLADNEDCPYCGLILLTNIHADHIYPLAKGGESTKKNMVLVCAECNSKKGSLTLQAFIKKYSLNRDVIEDRLSALGKDF